MKFFRMYLSFLILGLGQLTTLLLCKGTDLTTVFCQTLKSLSNDDIQRVEEIIKQPISEIQDILNNGDETAREKLIPLLSTIFADLLVTAASERAIAVSERAIAVSERAIAVSEKDEVKKFANTVLVPNLIPNSFRCAWNLIIEVLEKTYKKYKMWSDGQSLTSLIKLADGASNRNSEELTNMQEKILTKDEFISIIRSLAPKLDQTFASNVADHTVPEYKFRGKTLRYYEQVLLSFSAWTRFIVHSTTNLQKALVAEFKLLDEEEWMVYAQRFALTHSRDHFLGNNVKHVFWEVYQREISDGSEKDFDEILNDEYDPEWYYTKQNLDDFHLLIRALRKSNSRQITDLDLKFEPFLASKTIGMPQSPVCRYSKRDFNYFFKRWSTPSTSK